MSTSARDGTDTLFAEMKLYLLKKHAELLSAVNVDEEKKDDRESMVFKLRNCSPLKGFSFFDFKFEETEE